MEVNFDPYRVNAFPVTSYRQIIGDASDRQGSQFVV